MDDEAPIYTPASVDFQSGSIDLLSLHASLKRNQSAVVKRLVAIMEDENTSVKDAIRAAEILLSTNVQIAKEINADKLARMIAQARNGTPLLKQQGEISDSPIIDFENVQDV